MWTQLLNAIKYHKTKNKQCDRKLESNFEMEFVWYLRLQKINKIRNIKEMFQEEEIKKCHDYNVGGKERSIDYKFLLFE